jgi:hypothetical protein
MECKRGVAGVLQCVTVPNSPAFFSALGLIQRTKYGVVGYLHMSKSVSASDGSSIA